MMIKILAFYNKLLTFNQMGKNKGGVSKQQYKKNDKKQQQHEERQLEKRDERKNKRATKREKN
jgi:hypothetical protein